MAGDNIPIQRRYTRVLPLSLNTDVLATDDETLATLQILNIDNTILDLYSSPQNGAGINYEVRLIKNNIQSGRTFFSTASDPASAGRSVAGFPIPLSAGTVSYAVRQVLGALTAYSFVVSYANSF